MISSCYNKQRAEVSKKKLPHEEKCAVEFRIKHNQIRQDIAGDVQYAQSIMNPTREYYFLREFSPILL